ncbi:hypothetical protein EDB83DRAFT_2526135 [Lactarius deliciosus]|nr:hypothetical protein EDB83DRAFT_2526135 [Lactarius deliciosus]
MDPTNLSEPEDSMPSDVDPFDDEDMYSVDYNDEAISIGLDSDHVISDSSGSDVSDLGGTNSDGESQHLSGIMCDKTILQMERLQNDSENIFVMAKALCDSQGIVLSSDNKEPGRDPGDDDYDPQRENEVRAATAVLERLLGAWEYETDHVQTARAVSSYTPHPSTRYQEPWE